MVDSPKPVPSPFVFVVNKGENPEEVGKNIENHINSFYDKYIKKRYKRKSYLELEYEKLYLSLMMPQVRHGNGAAKKRYAGLVKKPKEKSDLATQALFLSCSTLCYSSVVMDNNRHDFTFIFPNDWYFRFPLYRGNHFSGYWYFPCHLQAAWSS